jgi:hypothetical protein
MRFRSHLLASAAAGLALYPRSPRKAALVAVSGCVLDVDHYVLYALRSGDWNPLGALRYNRRRTRRIRPGDTRPRYGPLRSVLHRKRLTIPLVWLAGCHRHHAAPAARHAVYTHVRLAGVAAGRRALRTLRHAGCAARRVSPAGATSGRRSLGAGEPRVVVRTLRQDHAE